uniref:RT_RNaseH domain-containing protein n=1 Tax=Panagrellus redivivus TaxID=6233 RepID=A0A7E4VXZ1_PANRE
YFIAKKCSESEQNYSVLQLEALAIVVAVRRLRMFIMGANVIVRTDHQPLLAMFKEQNSAQLVRWKLELQAYAGLRIEFVKGKANVVADALSRLPHTIDQGSHTEVLEAAIMVVEAMPTNDTEWEAAFGKDPDYAQLKRDANTEDGIELKGHKYVSKGSRLWRIDKNGQELQVVPQVFRK